MVQVATIFGLITLICNVTKFANVDFASKGDMTDWFAEQDPQQLGIVGFDTLDRPSHVISKLSNGSTIIHSMAAWKELGGMYNRDTFSATLLNGGVIISSVAVTQQEIQRAHVVACEDFYIEDQATSTSWPTYEKSGGGSSIDSGAKSNVDFGVYPFLVTGLASILAIGKLAHY